MTDRDPTPHSDRLLDAVAFTLKLLAKVEDPRERVRAILAVRAEVDHAAERFDELLGLTLLELRAAKPPAKFTELGGLLGGLTAQRAHAIIEKAKANQAKGTNQ